MSRARLGLALLAVVGVAACNSPEATRMRAGGPGADVGNRGRVVEMHGGSQPYWGTPRLVQERGEASTRTARQPERPGGPAASPR
jgi:hypothetical protein